MHGFPNTQQPHAACVALQLPPTAGSQERCPGQLLLSQVSSSQMAAGREGGSGGVKQLWNTGKHDQP